MNMILHPALSKPRSLFHCQEVVNQYDFVLFDCPPRLTTACVNALGCSDFLLVPVLLEQGSVEALTESLERLSTDEVRLKVIHGSVGAVNESDVMLASASNAIVLGFNVKAEPKAASQAQSDGVDLRNYSVIYDVLNDVRAALSGMLAPEIRETVHGRAQVKQDAADLQRAGGRVEGVVQRVARDARRDAADRACGRIGRGGDPGRAGHAAADGGGASQRAGPLPPDPDFPDGRQPLCLPHLERAPAVQPACGAGMPSLTML